MQKYKIAIVGATGFTGSELVRILINHPAVEIIAITSESRAGERFSEVHPQFKGICDTTLITAKEVMEENTDLAFLALPHGVSMDYVKAYKGSDFKIVDLSGDFRLSSSEVYSAWYPKAHTFPEGFHGAVYGLPELNKKRIASARLTANPGCYPTSAILGIAPLLSAKLMDPRGVIIDSKSGVTGAGVKPGAVNHFSYVNDNFKAYGISTHRHTIEIKENAEAVAGNEASIQFTPHLLPVDRGILSTIYARPARKVSAKEVQGALSDFYGSEPFVRVRDTPPTIKQVRGTNYCDIFATFDEATGNIIAVSVIDNLVKGAAGQAVQNMNLMLGLDESLGLNQVPLQP